MHRCGALAGAIGSAPLFCRLSAGSPYVTDLFDEVEERLRSDRFRTLAIKTAPWVLGLTLVVIVAVLGFFGWRDYQAKQLAKASEQYEAALDSLEKGDKTGAFQKFGDVAKSASGGYKALALMQQGSLRLADGKRDEAVALYDSAAKTTHEPVLVDAAGLKSALALLDSAPLKDVETRLKPLTAENRPYRAEALEALAFAKLAAGDLSGARSDFVVISLIPGASETARGRAEAAKALIDSGSAKEVPAAIKAAAALAPGPVSPAVSAVGEAPEPQQPTPGSQ